MPDPSTLKVGDKIRIVGVPKSDLAWASDVGYVDETLRVFEWMVGKEFTIWMIDEYGKPWVEVVGYPDGEGAKHTMAIMDSVSWVHVRA